MLAVIVTLTVVAAIMLRLSGRELVMSAWHRRTVEAFYLAEAGAHLARNSLRSFVVLGLSTGLHRRSVESLDELHNWLQLLVAGSGKLVRQCAGAPSSSPYTGRSASGSNSLALFDLAVGPSRNGISTGSPNHAPHQSVRYRYLAREGVYGLQGDGPDDSITPLGTGGFVARITIARDGNAWADNAFPECGGAPRYVFPFRYTIDVEGRAAGGRRRITLSGAFRLVVEEPSFAQYQWFSNTLGTKPLCPNHRPCRFWLPEETYDGPIHTNDRLWIAGSPVFRDRVTSANLLDDNGDGDLDPALGDAPGPPVARFYNGGAGCAGDAEPGGWCDRDAARNPPWDAPYFLRGFDRGWYYISLPAHAEPQEWTALFGAPPRGPDTTTPPSLTNGARRRALGLPLADDDVPASVFFPTGTETSRVDECYFRAAGRGGRLLGGIYVGRSLEALRLSVDGGTSVYELYTGPEHRWQVRIDREAKQTTVLYERRHTLLSCTYEGVPNGVMVVRGDIHEVSGPPRRRAEDPRSAPPAIHRDDALTVVALGTIRIATDLRYQEDPRGPDGVWSANPCTGDDRCGVRNLLALYSVTGDIRLSEMAPDEMVVQAVLMSAQGSVEVTAVDQRIRRRTLHLLGGKINRWEGLTGADVGAPRVGARYGLVHHHDHRLGRGLVDPPAFPRLGVIALRATPGLDDRPTWTERR